MALIKELSNGKLHVEFNSPGEVFRAIDAIGWTPQHSASSDSRGGGNFHSFGSLAEATDVMRNHPDRIRTFSTKDERLKTKDSPGRDVEFEITGDFLDIDRYLQGIPEVFGQVTMGNPRNMFCTINILSVYVHYTNPEYQDAKAMRVLRLVDWLEQQGVRTQIVATMDSRCMYASTIIKQFQDPFDINALAVVMHNDWLRRIMFLLIEQSKTYESGYGNAEVYDQRMINYVPRPEDGLYVYVGGYLSNNNKIDVLDEQFDHIEEQIEKVIADGMTYSEEPLVVKHERGRYY